ncbi:O-fucosyltransferase 9-like [Lolium rigidum]|uniref:O-fucosyltransferase 9-like n=1 Tax=Lolium rigidum TaxID=89674 RepID=UPI001F5C0ADB|nr:O-fucosyltransferase 9-like [Lolium rigidum]XP_047094290.1 O-fucosyltransferase 9-like [Lolium rigidum]
MENARERSWRGKFHRPGRVINREANRRDGKCPLTPLKVGMMLRGMGFNNTTFLYVASGKIQNAAKYMVPLRQMFPLLETKDTLALPEELAEFKGYSSRLAALDYTISIQSEVFVTTQGGNFPHFLMGHRRYLLGGNAKTIKPDKRKVVLSFDDPNIRCMHIYINRKHQNVVLMIITVVIPLKACCTPIPTKRKIGLCYNIKKAKDWLERYLYICCDSTFIVQVNKSTFIILHRA